MQNTSATKVGTVEFMSSSKGRSGFMGQGGRAAEPQLTSLPYAVEVKLTITSSPPTKPGQKAKKLPKNPHRLDVVVKVGQRAFPFTERWGSKLPSDRECKQWVQEYALRLLPKNATKIKVK